jgi:hypothetical protein
MTFHRNTAQVSSPIVQATAEIASPPASFDFYTSYCESFGKVYGFDKCPTREKWDAMCKAPRKVRKLTDDEFDHNQFSAENGDGEIY